MKKNILSRNFKILSVAQFINVIGDDFFNLAVMWTVYASTRSTVISGIIGIAWHLTDALIAPIAGVAADRLNKKKIIIFSNSLAFIVAAIIAIYILIFDEFPIFLAITSMCFLNILTSFVTPVRISIIAQLTDKDNLDQVNGIFSSITQISSVFSSSLSGWVLSFAGIAVSVALNSISYLLVILCFLFFNWKQLNSIEKSHDLNKNSLFQDLIDGFECMKEQKKIITICILAVLINLTCYTGTYFPALIYENFGENAAIYGLTQSIATAGVICGSLYLASNKLKGKNIITYCLMIMGITLGCMALSNNVIAISILTFIHYFISGIVSIFLNSVVMKIVPIEYLGRISSILKCAAICLIPVATFIVGIIGNYVSIQDIFVCTGIYLFIVSFYAKKIAN